MPNYVLAIDQGTTGSTALLLDMSDKARVIARHNVEFKQYYPQAGWVEHDLEEIWQSVGRSIEEVVKIASASEKSFKASSIAAIGITNQRETLCVYEKGTGKPVRKAIV